MPFSARTSSASPGPTFGRRISVESRIPRTFSEAFGHHGLEAIAVHRFDERRQLHGDALRFVDIATIERVGEVTHRTGGRVRESQR